MRIISGSARGRRLTSLPGQDTRPTTDRVKESIFNIVQFDVEGRMVLDLFAGSGQLGIEALSRGAHSVTFVELNGKCADIIRKNLDSTGFADKARVMVYDAVGFIESCRDKFDLIFLDPPYATKLYGKAIQSITEFDICREGGIILGESGREDKLPEVAAPYEKGRDYHYGSTVISLYHRRSGG